MAKKKVLVTRRWPEAVEKKLAESYQVELNDSDTPLTTSELKDAIGRCDAFCPTVSDGIGADVINAEGASAQIIGNFGVGFNHIDIGAAKERGLVVTNTPEVLTDCTADLAMTLMLMVARRAGEGERHVRHKEWTGWRPTHMMGTKVTGKTLGLIGFGRIARAMAHKAHFGFGMRIVYSDPMPPPPEVANAFGAVHCDSVEEVLQQSDFISLHCPGGDATRHLINADRLAMMRRGAFLINTARGDVVHNGALVEALRSGTIAGAGLDVYEGEPTVPEELLSMDNAVLLPHLGSASTETRVAMGMRVLENLQAFFDGREPRDRVI
ncbi:MAG: D-glycerate dehydrogenase [Gammaproteobacteria bacterium]|nr:D-glycerate dehydrogenase [Gammaproteobacteria bacterium]NNM00918.1 D-glycerate dehydrogenase [Gammaproteobacteria bacterium]